MSGYFLVSSGNFPPLSSDLFRQCELTQSAETAIDSVVKINTKMGSGSGFFVDSTHVVTNNHVLEGVKEAEVTLSSGKTISAKVVGGDEEADIAVLEVEAVDEIKPLKIIKSKEHIATDVVAIGYPLSEEDELKGDVTVTKGTISAYRDGLHGIKYVQTDTSINPGNSGGPLINECGEVVGVNDMFFRALDSADPIFYAISGEDVGESVLAILQSPTYKEPEGTLPRFEQDIKATDVVTAYYQSLYDGYLGDAYQLFSVSRQKEWAPDDWYKLFDDVMSLELNDVEQISSDPVKVRADITLYTTDGINTFEQETTSTWTLRYSLGRLALDDLDVEYGDKTALFSEDYEEAIKYNKSLADSMYPKILAKDMSYYPDGKVIEIKRLINENTEIIDRLYSKVTNGDPLEESELYDNDKFVDNHYRILEINKEFENIDLELYYQYYFGN